MLVHVFRSPNSKYAFTEDSAGSDLAAGDVSWQYLKNIELKNTDKRIGMDSKQAIEAIEADGYFIVPAGIGDVSG